MYTRSNFLRALAIFESSTSMPGITRTNVALDDSNSFIFLAESFSLIRITASVGTLEDTTVLLTILHRVLPLFSPAVATDGGSLVAGNHCVVRFLLKLLCARSPLADKTEGTSPALLNSCASSLCTGFHQPSGEKDLTLKKKLRSRRRNFVD